MPFTKCPVAVALGDELALLLPHELLALRAPALRRDALSRLGQRALLACAVLAFALPLWAGPRYGAKFFGDGKAPLAPPTQDQEEFQQEN
ncbi:MAG: hypothetical protein ABR562_10125, partial [Thermoplasmatota archaeon]